jgi:phosphoribosyl 1,2-cyclic phosphodiesterase
MKLHVLNSNSSGNCYLLIGETETLILEAGVPFKQVKQALNFDLTRVVGALVTHEHLDHSKAAHEYMNAGIDIWASVGTHRAIEDRQKALYGRARFLLNVDGHSKFQIGQFTILPFDVKHDAQEPLGFLISHPECGVVLFATDTCYIPNTFKGLNNVIIEANYCDDIINEKAKTHGNDYLRSRVFKSHMSIKTCLGALAANDLTAVNNIVLIHLSDSNSNAGSFKSQVIQATGKNVHIAAPGLIIDFNKTAF